MKPYRGGPKPPLKSMITQLIYDEILNVTREIIKSYGFTQSIYIIFVYHNPSGKAFWFTGMF